MLANICKASDCGLKSWHHGYFVGTVLHMYHCLVKLEVLAPEEYPLLDGLCKQLLDTVFLGELPARNLWGCYQRWMGKRIRFHGRRNDAGRCSEAGDGSKKWDMRCVQDCSQGGDNVKRKFDPKKASLIFSLISSDYVVNDYVLASVCRPKTGKVCASTRSSANTADRTLHASPKDIKEARKALTTETGTEDFFRSISETIKQELCGPFPVAKLNYLTIYETCVDILSRVNDLEHDDYHDYICPCVMERLLKGVDSKIDRHCIRSTPFPDRDLLHHCRQGFADAMKSKNMVDFCWDLGG